MIKCLPINAKKEEGDFFNIGRKPNFNGGEINFQLNEEALSVLEGETLIMQVQLKTSDDIMELAMAVDAIRRRVLTVELILLIGYFPYGRQDRVCNEGEALGVQVMANMINSMGFTKVIVADPHSEAICAALDNCEVFPQHEIIAASFYNSRPFFGRDSVILVSPDAGANKKTLALAKEWGKPTFIRADKVRETATGAISDIVVYADDLTGKVCIIVDDICDRGGTFMGLAKALRDKGADEVHLYVTHAILPDGVSKLLDNGIDTLFTTDSFGELDVPEKYTGRVIQDPLFYKE